MPELLLIAFVILLLPVLPWKPLWMILTLALVLPGTYALFDGPLFLPTRKKILKRMMALAKIQREEKVYDLGCGDGRFVFAAAKRGAKAIGYELSIPVFLFAKMRSLFHRGSSIRFGNFWSHTFKDADVIFCFFVTDAMRKFEKEIWPTLKPGCRVVSNTFRMTNVKPVKEKGQVFLYIKR